MGELLMRRGAEGDGARRLAVGGSGGAGGGGRGGGRGRGRADASTRVFESKIKKSPRAFSFIPHKHGRGVGLT
jgi:hypothetical protein